MYPETALFSGCRPWQDSPPGSPNNSLMNTELPVFPFDRYIRYDELTELLHALAGARPDLVQVDSIGKSWEGRDIWCATVTNTATGPDRDKPAFYADGNIHATEVSPTTACLYLLRKLVAGHGVDAELTRALDTRAFYIIPRVNPDGAEVFLSDRPRYLRSSTRPYPFDEEPLDGLRREDIDGNGLLLQMRVRDDLGGPWKKHPDEPRMLIRREPTETGGEYYRLLPEGRLTNYDGATFGIQRNKEGLDLNRNFPASWRAEHEQPGAGPYPTSEPEARALVAFIAAHNNICGAVTFHTYGGLLLRPYGTQSDEALPAEDLWTYQALGKKGTEITGYPNISVFHDFRYHPKEVITGVFDDWCYDHLGIFAWTTELWSPQRQAGITEYKFIDWYRDHPVEDDWKMLRWADEKLAGKGYHDWQPFDHPELGPIEIGGWDVLSAFRNPPPQFLEAEVAPHADWLIWQALCSPLMVVHSSEVTPLGGGHYKIRLVVQNTGWLPSYVSKKALERKAVRPVIAEIALGPGVKLITGKQREELTQLEGRAYKPAGNAGGSADATEDRARVEWVVRVTGEEGARVKLIARHDRAGTVRLEVPLAA
jgi:murein tripeptide amidase MpaA